MTIEFQCPQCGAPAALEETDRLFACQYCRVKSYLLADRHQFVLSHPVEEAKAEQLFYFPYWRFKGTLFAVARNGINHRLVDVSYRAVPLGQFPASMGLRTQAMRLRFLSPGLPGQFLKPTVGYPEIVEMVTNNFTGSFPRPVYFHELIGETLSIVWAPFFVENEVVDAVLSRKVSGPVPDDLDLSSMIAPRMDWNVQFVATLCPQCGWDMQGQKDSIALHCRQCVSMWYPGPAGFDQVAFGTVVSDHRDVVYLPFYRIRADVQGLQLKTQADLIRLSNQVKVIKPESQAQPFYFWSPAFKIRAKEFLHFSSVLTINQPPEKWQQHIAPESFFPVTLPYCEAAESMRLSLASFAKPEKAISQRLREIHIRPLDWMVVYLPFQRRGFELSHAKYLLRVNTNLLNYAKN